MTLIITGSEGNIGRRLRLAFPGCIGIDRAAGAEIRVDLSTVDYGEPMIASALRDADALIHLATSADPDAPEAVHWRAVSDATRLFAACAAQGVGRIVVASSDWAAPKHGAAINSYGRSKLALGSLAAMYAAGPRSARVIRVGWVPHDPAALVAAPDWLRQNYWDDDRLTAEFRRALSAEE
ncbi:nucleoside-diphosphate-sugar epimerase [Inquilinus ginsengisoli]|uniref:NAD-dependent epimerase/dehydratase family protein n=1 Tax=Inquilinus ginsengisoli TaxID=363840 RepID=UPI003D2156A8